MKVLLLGGSRFFGRELALLLIREGHELTVLTRGRAPVPEGSMHVQADRADQAALRQVARNGYDAVIDNIAYNACHVRTAVQAFTGWTGHYVLTSSTVVYLPGSRPPYFEHAVLAEPDSVPEDAFGSRAYVVGKMEAERELTFQARLPFSIVRPPVVIGPHDHTLRLHFYVQRVLDGAPLLLVAGGRYSFHLADSIDLARGFLLILQTPESSVGKAYNLCQRDTVTLRELVATVAVSLGRELRVIDIPRDVLKAFGFSYSEPFGPLIQPMIAPPEKACRELGYEPRPALDAVAEAARWHAAHSSADSPGYEHRAREIEIAKRYGEVLRAVASRQL